MATRNTFPGFENTISRVKKHRFPCRELRFPGCRTRFPSKKHRFPVSRNALPGFRNAFPAWKTPFPGLRYDGKMSLDNGKMSLNTFPGWWYDVSRVRVQFHLPPEILDAEKASTFTAWSFKTLSFEEGYTEALPPARGNQVAACFGSSSSRGKSGVGVPN
jgi:hypothetical protein